MLSKTSIIILGMLCKEEQSAYDILKKLGQMNIKYWLPIGDTTLYETAVRLEKRNLITGTQVNKKLIYSITDEGKIELCNTISDIFRRMDYDTIWFSLATMYCNILPEEEMQILIVKRKQLLKEYHDGIAANIQVAREHNDDDEQSLFTLERMLQIIELEQQSLNLLLLHRIKKEN